VIEFVSKRVNIHAQESGGLSNKIFNNNFG